MKHLRMFAMAGLFALAVAAPGLSGCSTLQGLGDSITGPPGTAEVTTVYAAEQAYTVAAHTGTIWLKSGKATPAQAATALAIEKAIYGYVEAGRTAAANNDNPGVALALKLFNQAMPQLTGYISKAGG